VVGCAGMGAVCCAHTRERDRAAGATIEKLKGQPKLPSASVTIMSYEVVRKLTDKTVIVCLLKILHNTGRRRHDD